MAAAMAWESGSGQVKRKALAANLLMSLSLHAQHPARDLRERPGALRSAVEARREALSLRGAVGQAAGPILGISKPKRRASGRACRPNL